MNARIIETRISIIIIIILLNIPTVWAVAPKKAEINVPYPNHIDKRDFAKKNIINLPDSKVTTKNGLPFAQPDYPTIDFHLDWTTCQMHRVASDSTVEILLDGTVSIALNSIWTLIPDNPIPQADPSLYFVENIFGEINNPDNSDIPLSWEISINGGDFKSIERQSDGSLKVRFPAGDHAFQVRISGYIPITQADGYYRLQLIQNIIPEL
ncbi:MAG: hypothetical protein GF315_04695 [candidate division Zixibacteria bacterium]|nr:hypothetical protein [candidate division Zixibacteria bacterium]